MGSEDELEAGSGEEQEEVIFNQDYLNIGHFEF